MLAALCAVTLQHSADCVLVWPARLSSTCRGCAQHCTASCRESRGARLRVRVLQTQQSSALLLQGFLAAGGLLGYLLQGSLPSLSAHFLVAWHMCLLSSWCLCCETVNSTSNQRFMRLLLQPHCHLFLQYDWQHGSSWQLTREMCLPQIPTTMLHAVAGGASGAMLMLLGFISLSYFHKGQLCKLATVASLAMSAALTAVMFKRYTETGTIFPALTFMVASAGMSAFYVWSLAAGPKPKSAKAQA